MIEDASVRGRASVRIGYISLKGVRRNVKLQR